MIYLKRYVIVVVFIFSILVSFFLYANSISGTFLYDDIAISSRPELRQASYLPKIWVEPYYPNDPEAGGFRPFVIFAFATHFIIFGDSPSGFHVVNILLNGFVTFLLFLVILRLFGKLSLAFVAAGLFAFFPIHSEAVAFIKSQDELWAAVFTLLSWLVFLQA